MEKCEKCLYYKSKTKCGECGRLSNAMDNNPMFTPNTNYDRIKSMSVEEMADIIFDIYKQGFFDAVHSDDVTEREEIIQWLLQEVKDDENN
jgi:ArsR family metal-binding transcriptional regulator